MKSSSRLFPARLERAEALEFYSEDTYVIKPNNSPDKHVEIAITHLQPIDVAQDSRAKTPLILLHGNYQNRYFWYLPQGEGLAIDLLSRFDIWLMEVRGHGLSPVNPAFHRNTLIDYARYDLPAVNAFVAEQTSRSPLWLGYCEGAAALLYAVANGSLQSESTAGVVGLGNPWREPSWLKLPFSRALQSIMIRGLHQAEVRGPEMESGSLVRAHRYEHGLFARPGSGISANLWQDLAASSVPLFWLGTAKELRLYHQGLGQLVPETLQVSDKAVVSSDSFCDVTAADVAEALNTWMDTTAPASESTDAQGEQSELLST